MSKEFIEEISRLNAELFRERQTVAKLRVHIEKLEAELVLAEKRADEAEGLNS